MISKYGSGFFSLLENPPTSHAARANSDNKANKEVITRLLIMHYTVPPVTLETRVQVIYVGLAAEVGLLLNPVSKQPYFE